MQRTGPRQRTIWSKMSILPSLINFHPANVLFLLYLLITTIGNVSLPAGKVSGVSSLSYLRTSTVLQSFVIIYSSETFPPLSIGQHIGLLHWWWRDNWTRWWESSRCFWHIVKTHSHQRVGKKFHKISESCYFTELLRVQWPRTWWDVLWKWRSMSLPPQTVKKSIW